MVSAAQKVKVNTDVANYCGSLQKLSYKKAAKQNCFYGSQ